MHPLIARYARITGDDPESILSGQQMRALRVNTLRIQEQELIARLRDKDVTLTQIPFLEHAYTFQADFSLGATEEYLLGYYYLQEAASQLPVQALKNILGKSLKQATVLDMAAAPGSKTTQLAQAMNNSGTLIAIDADMNRSKALADNLERCGVTNTTAYVKDGRYIEDLEQEFDAILLDAPCSGNLTLQDDWLDNRTLLSARHHAPLQQELLTAAWGVLKPGGVLIYSTCSLEPEENEQAILAALPQDVPSLDMGLSSGDPGLTELDGQEYGKRMERARRLWPHRHATQGFFVIAIQKPGPE